MCSTIVLPAPPPKSISLFPPCPIFPRALPWLPRKAISARSSDASTSALRLTISNAPSTPPSTANFPPRPISTSPFPASPTPRSPPPASMSCRCACSTPRSSSRTAAGPAGARPSWIPWSKRFPPTPPIFRSWFSPLSSSPRTTSKKLTASPEATSFTANWLSTSSSPSARCSTGRATALPSAASISAARARIPATVSPALPAPTPPAKSSTTSASVCSARPRISFGLRLASLHCCGENLLHDAAAAPAGRVAGPLRVAPAVRPDGVHNAPERRDALVVALLVAVVDARAGEEAVAVVLVGLRVGHAEARAEGHAVALRQEDVGLELPAGAVVARVIERDIDRAGHRIGGQPLVEAVHCSQGLRHRLRRRPRRALVVGDRDEDVGVGAARGEVHPGTADAALVRALGAVHVAG